MAISKISNVAIRGICCALPGNPIPIEEMGKGYFSDEEIKKVSDTVGVKTLYHARPGQTASDLCCEAADRLIADLGWDKKSIDGLVFISQTPDYIIPSTANILQHRLGLSKDCLALGINLGCSGFVYGVWLASQFISSKACTRVLVLIGDTLSSIVSKQDRATALIFSDGVSATALEYSEDHLESTFMLLSDGSGGKHLMVPAGGFRKPKDSGTEGNLYMDGMEILLFTLREIPTLIKKLIKDHGWDSHEIDKVLLHQANGQMLNAICKSAKIPMEKVPLNIDKVGNTSGSSIPLLICDQLKEDVKGNKIKVVMAGFGSGLSWGAAALELKDVHCSEILLV